MPDLKAHALAEAFRGRCVYFITLHADGQSWSPTRWTDKETPGAPAMVPFAGRMFMAMPSSEKFHHVVVSESTDAETWTTTFSDWETYRAPALAVLGDALHMVYVGVDDNRLYHSWRTADSDWILRVDTGKSSVDTPALAVYDGKPHMTHRGGNNNDQRLLHCQYDTATGAWTSSEQAADNESYSGPAMVNYCDPNAATATDPQAVTEELYTAFRGSYDKIIG
ncbi:hypothetical protein ACGFR6_34855 [Streptomyces sp. NPDC048567]|uniref:hypothetical protein n=1 Tax=Streptomyces sp. NPDC048567 TaxID=3365570 RepID=UPI003721FCBB